ncbi:uncharacterized protein G2W53_027442 [Senna tora]|uniref:Uncharacterized protein n=1 Tax=Senna tora TaxID=362788 RepID=A0A834TIQ1_9FABA|nr:uncharacterized protein G2W53_027442 [Senna tora]
MAKFSHTLSKGIHTFDSPHAGLGYILPVDLNGS